ncbi:hypothetical protein [Phaeovulum vinaykumarii]|uniref:HEPN domain-containing protein n=1 Tax=Phaeovulum vinaykumarii TaxID=407234 RepID=A0A1N7M4I3_9RHOB|nr:hypothetical protein [Phaeovulum vinaykumarii]SIS80952.1 hypothetical protein SAMN05421795_105177 [Phaeovulum vinaykumarii]SOC08806.1 hypothetical protein SAMN05878426_10525 [Phaeovulum vinaykumarii]
MTDRLTSTSNGTHAHGDWMAEGRGLLASAEETRALWERRRSAFSAELKAAGRFDSRRHAELYTQVYALPRAAMLLLGQAAEMFAKAGLTRAYAQCPGALFDRDLKTFGHDLPKLAREIAFPARGADPANLTQLHRMVLVDARYPLAPAARPEWAAQANARTDAIWPEAQWAALRDLVARLQAHAGRIDHDPACPASIRRHDLADGGYVVFRTGGHLPDRITFRMEAAQRQPGKASPAAIAALLARLDPADGGPPFDRAAFRARARLIEDGLNDRGQARTWRHPPAR